MKQKEICLYIEIRIRNKGMSFCNSPLSILCSLSLFAGECDAAIYKIALQIIVKPLRHSHSRQEISICLSNYLNAKSRSVMISNGIGHIWIILFANQKVTSIWIYKKLFFPFHHTFFYSFFQGSIISMSSILVKRDVKWRKKNKPYKQNDRTFLLSFIKCNKKYDLLTF